MVGVGGKKHVKKNKADVKAQGQPESRQSWGMQPV